jgi:hypothetical protein
VLKKLLLFGCLPVLLLTGGGSLIIYRMATWRPAPAERRAPPPPEQARSARAKIQAVGTRLRAARRRGRRAAPQILHLALTEPELNALLLNDPNAQRSLAEAGLTDPRLELENGLITLSGYLTQNDQEVFVSATGAVSRGADGQVALDLRSVRVGRLPAPPALHQLIADRAAEALRSVNQSSGGRLNRLAVEGKTLVIDGTSQAFSSGR